jgi:SAM-dependent methyltransferase
VNKAARVTAGDLIAPAERLLRQIGEVLAGQAGIELEFSLRVRRSSVEVGDRYTIWLSDPEAFNHLLTRLQVPVSLPAWISRPPLVRLGLGVAAGADGVELRCYRHDRIQDTLKDRYRSWRWRHGGDAGQPCAVADYAFHFVPETPDGRTPLTLIDPALRPAFAALVQEDRFRLGSGFWLRTESDGHVSQVDLALPWHPLIGELPALSILMQQLGRLPAELDPWRDLPIRHIAAKGGEAATIYAKAPLRGNWPDSQAALREQVRATARRVRGNMETHIFADLPTIPPAASDWVDLDRFYGGDIGPWRTILGEGLHYHFGLFVTAELNPSDDEMDAAMRRAVTDLFPLIPAGSRVYDIGCGWGTPLAMLAREHGCPTLGLTISKAQFRHVAALGLPVRWGDAEQTLPPGRFDCALLLESLSHIRDKVRLLRVLRRFAGRLAMRVNCQDSTPAGARFGGSMQMISANDLRQMLGETGWRIRHWRDRRAEAIPSVMVWHRRLRRLPPTGDPHLETMRAWCARVAAMPQEWAKHNPLIEVMAE